MKTLPTQQRALRKRQALIDAAIVEFSSDGFEVATAKSIAATAQVATGTFYQYFENKYDILRVIAQHRFDCLHQQIQAIELKIVDELRLNASTITSRFFNTLMFVYEYHAQDPELHQVLEQRRTLDPELKVIMDQGEQVLRDRVVLFVRSCNISNADLVAENLFSMAEGLVHRLVFHTSDVDVEDSLRIGAQMLASYFINQQHQH